MTLFTLINYNNSASQLNRLIHSKQISLLFLTMFE